MLKNTRLLYKYRTTALKQPYQKFFILDFEATCDEKKPPVPQEIIEFPCLCVDSTDFTVTDKFHRFVKPTVHPVLSAFCTHLTGIKQEDVDNESEFPVVYDDFLKWLRKNTDSTDPSETIFVTCGNWDLKTMLPNQCKSCGLQVPPQLTRWINIKTSFFKGTGYYPRSIVDMFQHFDLKMEGRQHSGIDDCRNLHTIVQHLSYQGVKFEETDRI